MKNVILTMVLACLMAKGAEAQIGPYDRAARIPMVDVYDEEMMDAYLRAMTETAALRKANFEQFCALAIEAYGKGQWNNAIHYVNHALNTRYYNGQLYYIRGYAYEQLGDLKTAKKDYKKGAQYGSREAVRALQALKERKKQRRRK